MPYPPDVVLDFTRATLAHEEVLLLDEDGHKDGTAGMVDAVFEGRAFMGDIRPGRIVFDVDADKGGSDWAPPGRAALESIGCSVVRVTSGSPSSEHWWFTAPVGWDGQDLRDLAVQAGVPADQIRWGGADCRPPLSPHRLGYPVDLVEPSELGAALSRLQSRAGAIPFKEEVWEHVILTGDTVNGKYKGSRAKAAAGLATALVNSGLGRADLAIRLESSPVFSKKLEGLRGAKEKWIDNLWDGALEFVRDNPAVPQLRRDLAKLDATVAGRIWKGRAGQTDRSVYGRLVTIGHLAHSTDVGQSQRALEEHLGISRKTVAASLERLGGAGLVERIRRGGAEHSAVYRLHPESALNDANMYLRCPVKEKESSTGIVRGNFVLPDGFRGRGALPPSSFDTWLVLPKDCFITVGDLVALRGGGLTGKTVRAHLRALHSLGLAGRNGPKGHRWRGVDADSDTLDAIAAQLGTKGRTAQTKSLNAQARIANRAALAGRLPTDAQHASAHQHSHSEKRDQMTMQELNTAGLA